MKVEFKTARSVKNPLYEAKVKNAARRKTGEDVKMAKSAAKP